MNNKNLFYIIILSLPITFVAVLFVMLFLVNVISSHITANGNTTDSDSVSAYVVSMSGTMDEDIGSNSGSDTEVNSNGSNADTADLNGDKSGSSADTVGLNDDKSGSSADAVGLDGDKSGNSEDTQNEGETDVKYIFVGDSRYVGMSIFAQSDDIFMAANGEGYNFLSENFNKILEYADKNSIVIVGLGVNDYAVNYNNYIRIMNQLADTLESDVYYMLINPVDEEKERQYGYTTYNEMIDRYNAIMVAGFNSNVKVIDTNTYLKEDGFSTLDGLHYDDITYKKIYNYLKSSVS